MAENVVEILVKAKDMTKAAFAAAEKSAEASGAKVESIWSKHSDGINKKLGEIGKNVASNSAKGGGLFAIGSAALAAAAPLGALGVAVGAFGAVAIPELSKVHEAMTKTGKAGQQAWKQLTPSEQAMGNAIKGVEASFHNVQKALAPVIDSVVELGAKTLKDAMPALGKLAGAGGQVIQAFLKPLDAFIKSKTFAQLIDQITKFAVTTGKLLGPVLVQLISLLLQLFVKLMPSGIKILQALLPLIILMVTDLTPVIVVVAKVIANIVTWLEKTHLLIPALAALSIAIFALGGPISAIIIAFALIVTAIVELAKHWKAIWGDIKNWSEGVFHALPKPLQEALKFMFAEVKLEFGFIKAFFKIVWAEISGVFRVSLDLITGKWGKAWTDLKRMGEQIWNAIKGFLGQVWSAIESLAGSKFDSMRHKISNIFDGIRHEIAHVWDLIFSNTIGSLIRIGHNVETQFNSLRHGISVTFSNIRHDIASAWDTIWNNTVGRVSRGIGDVTGWFRGLPGKIISALGNAGRLLFGWGSGVISGLLSGMTNIIGSVWNFIKGIPGKILHFLGIHSPPQWAIDAGKHIMNGLGIGMGQAQKALKINTDQFSPGQLVGSVGSGVQRWKGIVDQALRMQGLPTGLDSRVLYQMQTESGGNPNAINRTDINAQHGDPSRGLMQVIGSTFRAFHVPGTSGNIYDPLANIAAAINYARHRYGPGLEVRGFGIGSGHGYASGGPASGWAMVGEHGRELVRLPAGSQVYPNGATESMASGNCGYGPQVFQLEVTGSDQELVALIRKMVRVKGGGNVQRAFGR